LLIHNYDKLRYDAIEEFNATNLTKTLNDGSRTQYAVVISCRLAQTSIALAY